MELGIKEVTVFALSTENLKRSEVEVATLMDLAKHSFTKMTENGGFLQERGVQIKMLGDLSLVPEDVSAALKEAERRTIDNTMCRLNVCLCYNS
mmetsp:Transcript_25542/g.24840  ORF Transcript_25542/g.24840 Transcript_25542/m.24840 type:complete len:94 (-) Transcript_25542:313-594(-)